MSIYLQPRKPSSGRRVVILNNPPVMSLCRRKQTIRQIKWPDSYGARSAIWYRRRQFDAFDTRSLTLRHTGRGIFLLYRSLSPVAPWWAYPGNTLGNTLADTPGFQTSVFDYLGSWGNTPENTPGIPPRKPYPRDQGVKQGEQGVYIM
jgi:hypothetical protein